jgi:hypothetical protein
MLAQGEAKPKASETLGTRQEKATSPGGAAEPSANVSVALPGLVLTSLLATQGSVRKASLHPGLTSVAAPRLKIQATRFNATLKLLDSVSDDLKRGAAALAGLCRLYPALASRGSRHRASMRCCKDYFKSVCPPIRRRLSSRCRLRRVSRLPRYHRRDKPQCTAS